VSIDPEMVFGEFLGGVIKAFRYASENVLLPRTHDALLENSLRGFWCFLDEDVRHVQQRVPGVRPTRCTHGAFPRRL
jgi:hypothetical protein